MRLIGCWSPKFAPFWVVHPLFLLAISDLNGSSQPASLVFALQNSSAGRIVSNREPQARSKIQKLSLNESDEDHAPGTSNCTASVPILKVWKSMSKGVMIKNDQKACHTLPTFHPTRGHRRVPNWTIGGLQLSGWQPAHRRPALDMTPDGCRTRGRLGHLCWAEWEIPRA